MNVLQKKLVEILESKKENSQKGFTLLELLVVVAILAAIAGTATIALKDTDARASAAAHVAMMDELNKGIRTYRILKKNELPGRFDSLLSVDDAGTPTAYADPNVLGFVIADEDVEIAALANVEGIMTDGGITSLMYLDLSATGVEGEITGVEDCANPKALIGSRKNAVVAGNIFMTPNANGCGAELVLADTASAAGLFWTGDPERLTGDPTEDAFGTAGANAYLLTGVGPSSSLFNVNELGGMTTVPVYRHVAADEYGRFIAVWNVGTWTGTDVAGGLTTGDQAELVAIVDGALDTKEEELGEWDGTRNTI